MFAAVKVSGPEYLALNLDVTDDAAELVERVVPVKMWKERGEIMAICT